jgi:hypothetical protein
MNEQKNTTGQGLGIAGLVLGISAIVLGAISCTFLLALACGITGIILSSVGLSQVSQRNGARGLLIAALVCSILGTTIASFRPLTMGKGPMMFRRVMKEEFREEFGKGFEKAFKSFGDDMEEVLEDLEEELEKDLEEELDDDLVDTLKNIEKETE